MFVMLTTAHTNTISYSIFLLDLLFLFMLSSVVMGAPKLWHGRVHSSLAVSRYKDLQSIYNYEDGVKKGTPRKSVLTKTDAKFEASKHLFATSGQFKDAVAVMSDTSDASLDPDTSRTKIKENVRQVRKHIIPLMQYGADTINKTAKTLTPIASMMYVHKRNEQKRKQEVLNPNHKKMGANL